MSDETPATFYWGMDHLDEEKVKFRKVINSETTTLHLELLNYSMVRRRKIDSESLQNKRNNTIYHIRYYCLAAQYIASLHLIKCLFLTHKDIVFTAYVVFLYGLWTRSNNTVPYIVFLLLLTVNPFLYGYLTEWDLILLGSTVEVKFLKGIFRFTLI